MRMYSSNITKKRSFSFSDVLRFAGGYWIRQPKKLCVIMIGLLIASLLETYLPTALASFLSAIQQHQEKKSVLYFLGIFLGTYVAQTLIFSMVYLVYNSFETNLFKSLVDDVFKHIYR